MGILQRRVLGQSLNKTPKIFWKRRITKWTFPQREQNIKCSTMNLYLSKISNEFLCNYNVGCRLKMFVVFLQCWIAIIHFVVQLIEYIYYYHPFLETKFVQKNSLLIYMLKILERGGNAPHSPPFM